MNVECVVAVGHRCNEDGRFDYNESKQAECASIMADYQCANMNYNKHCHLDDHHSPEVQEHGKMCSGDAMCRERYTQRYIGEQYQMHYDW